MKFSYGTKVFDKDGEKVGVVSELIIEPRSRVITHIVVQKGLLFHSDQLVPCDLIERMDEEEVQLSVTAAQLKAEMAKEYNRDEYVPFKAGGDQDIAGTAIPGAIWARPMGTTIVQAPYPAIVPPGIGPLPPTPEIILPINEIMLEKGSTIRTSDGNEIGTLQECLTDDDDNITHVLIKEGRFFSVPKLIPIDWVAGIKDNEVLLAVDADTVDKLPEPPENY